VTTVAAAASRAVEATSAADADDVR